MTLADELARALYDMRVEFLDDKDAYDWSEMPAAIKAIWLNEANKRLAPVVKYITLHSQERVEKLEAENAKMREEHRSMTGETTR